MGDDSTGATIGHVDEVPVVERLSPGRRYQLFRRRLSRFLADADSDGDAGDSPPFEVELAELPPGATNYPQHAHTTQWEFFFVLSGRGQMRRDDRQFEIKQGDFVMQPPGVAHQLVNETEESLRYLVIANNPQADIVHYPNSDKWMVRPPDTIFRMQPADYYDGEQDVPGS